MSETAAPGRVHQSRDQARPDPRFSLRDHAVLLKPRVMSLVVFTALVGLLLAPAAIDPLTAVVAVACIAVGAGAAGSLNMWYDRDIDRAMERTRNRPVPAGRLTPGRALWLGLTLAAAAVGVMAWQVNAMAAGLLALTIGYYVVFYTMWLKRRTPYNIVIGGAAGAFPPMIGWTAATGDLGLGAIALFLIIFLWTPPHSWALALFRKADYDRAGVPMLPVVAGDAETRRQICVYTWLLVPATLLPAAVGTAGLFYVLTAVGLGLVMIARAVRLQREADTAAARSLFFFSILYLFGIFLALLLDRAMQPHL